MDRLLNELKIKDQNKRFKVFRAIDKFDRIDENFIELLKKERIDPISGDKISGADLNNTEAQTIVDFLKIKELKDFKNIFKNKLMNEGIDEIEEILNVLKNTFKHKLK